MKTRLSLFFLPILVLFMASMVVAEDRAEPVPRGDGQHIAEPLPSSSDNSKAAEGVPKGRLLRESRLYKPGDPGHRRLETGGQEERLDFVQRTRNNQSAQP